MRKLLKPVAALLSMALLAGILASCGGNGAAESSAGGKTDSSAASSTTESTVHTLKILGRTPETPTSSTLSGTSMRSGTPWKT